MIAFWSEHIVRRVAQDVCDVFLFEERRSAPGRDVAGGLVASVEGRESDVPVPAVAAVAVRRTRVVRATHGAGAVVD